MPGNFGKLGSGFGQVGDSRGGGGSVYTPSLEFSDARNSMYIGQVV